MRRGGSSVIGRGVVERCGSVGAKEVGQNALIRFYTLHVIGLPTVALLLMFVHFWRIRKDGGISRPL